MTEREDLLGRLTELDAGERSRRLTARSIQKMINHGDYAGAATAMDDLEVALHPALAAAGGLPTGLPLYSATRELTSVVISPGVAGFIATDTVVRDDLGIDDAGDVIPTGGTWLVGGAWSESSAPGTGTARGYIEGNFLPLSDNGGSGLLTYPLGPTDPIGLLIPPVIVIIPDANTDSLGVRIVNATDDDYEVDYANIWLVKLA